VRCRGGHALCRGGSEKSARRKNVARNWTFVVVWGVKRARSAGRGLLAKRLLFCGSSGRVATCHTVIGTSGGIGRATAKDF
jgi:hypothetical protein